MPVRWAFDAHPIGQISDVTNESQTRYVQTDADTSKTGGTPPQKLPAFVSGAVPTASGYELPLGEEGAAPVGRSLNTRSAQRKRLGGDDVLCQLAHHANARRGSPATRC